MKKEHKTWTIVCNCCGAIVNGVLPGGQESILTFKTKKEALLFSAEMYDDSGQHPKVAEITINFEI